MVQFSSPIHRARLQQLTHTRTFDFHPQLQRPKLDCRHTQIISNMFWFCSACRHLQMLLQTPIRPHAARTTLRLRSGQPEYQLQCRRGGQPQFCHHPHSYMLGVEARTLETLLFCTRFHLDLFRSSCCLSVNKRYSLLSINPGFKTCILRGSLFTKFCPAPKPTVSARRLACSTHPFALARPRMRPSSEQTRIFADSGGFGSREHAPTCACSSSLKDGL